MPEFVSFNQFRDHVHGAKIGAEVDRRFPEAEARGAAMAMRAAPGAARSAHREAYASELDKILTFLRRFYPADVSVGHTFHNHDGVFVDCIPIADVATARAARAAKVTIPTRPPVPVEADPDPEPQGFNSPPVPAQLVFPLRQGLRDTFGRRVACPDGCVPIARTTPDDMTRVGSFEQFFFKPQHLLVSKKAARGKPKPKPKPAARPRRLVAPRVGGPGDNGFRYACVVDTQQGTPYFGCATGLSIREPFPPPPSTSISQFWMLGDNMGSAPQTVESGWMVQRALSGSDSPVLFVFFNPDGYGPRSGYVTNATASAGFVPNPNTPFVVNQQGFFIPPAQGANPTAFKLLCQFINVQGAPGWYLYYGNLNQRAADLVNLGFFPAAFYQGTTLATNALEVRFGGECGGLLGVTPGSPPGYTEMGSGDPPTTDDHYNYQNVAFQCNTRVYKAAGQPSSPTQLQELRVDRADGFDLSMATDPAFASYVFFGGRMSL